MIRGDCRELLPKVKDNTVDLVVTGLPYWGSLAPSYSILGHERTFADYLVVMVEDVIDELLRVCRGPIWLVGGDDKSERIVGQCMRVALAAPVPILRRFPWYSTQDVQDCIAIGNRPSVLEGQAGNEFVQIPRDKKDFQTFPRSLVKLLIELSRVPDGGTVLDPFAGSGTVGEVCTEMGLASCLMEGRDA